LVPKLSLQPLVENVYQHGWFIHGGTMIIRIKKVADDVVLSVSDNGETPDLERLRQINRGLSQSETFSQIGLQNVHKRIQMMFGSAYGLAIERIEEQAVTCVSIRLPYRRDMNEAEAGRD